MEILSQCYLSKVGGKTERTSSVTEIIGDYLYETVSSTQEKTNIMIKERKDDNDGDGYNDNDVDHFRFLLNCYF